MAIKTFRVQTFCVRCEQAPVFLATGEEIDKGDAYGVASNGPHEQRGERCIVRRVEVRPEGKSALCRDGKAGHLYSRRSATITQVG